MRTRKHILVLLISVLLPVFVVTAVAYATTTIGNNVSVGGTLTVTGTTTFSGVISGASPLVFEGATADDYETTFAITDPTADRTITFPNITGTVVTTGDTGSVNSTMITDGTIVNADVSSSAAIDLSKLATGALPTGITVASANLVDGTIVNADVSSSAAIAGTKISPDFGSQNIQTTGSLTIGGGTAITEHISSSTAIDFGSIPGNGCETQTVAGVSGAVDGDVVTLGVPNNVASASSTLVFTGWVSAADTVSVRVCQVASGDSGNLPSGTFRVDVWKH